MAWTEFFVGNTLGGKTVIDPTGRAYFSKEVGLREYVEIHMTTTPNELPFKIVFKSFDSIGGILEEREYGQAGTKELARKIAVETENLRLNSREFVLDGE
jgi:hypothetical protein